MDAMQHRLSQHLAVRNRHWAERSRLLQRLLRRRGNIFRELPVRRLVHVFQLFELQTYHLIRTPRGSCALLQQKVGKKVFHLKDMGGQIAQRGRSAANLDVERRRVFPEILKPALSEIVGISEQVAERNSSFVHGMSLAPQRRSGNTSPVNARRQNLTA